MEKAVLLEAMARCQADWTSTIEALGQAGLELPGAVGRWRVRDVLAHFNGWDRWQLVQLGSAFTGVVPEGSALTGGLDLPPADTSLPFTDGMNASFVDANHDRPLDAVIADWRELCEVRMAWVTAAPQDHLDAVVGADWSGTPGRYVRLHSEVPGVRNPKTAARFVMEQVEHQLDHLGDVREWMARR